MGIRQRSVWSWKKKQKEEREKRNGVREKWYGWLNEMEEERKEEETFNWSSS